MWRGYPTGRGGGDASRGKVKHPGMFWNLNLGQLIEKKIQVWANLRASRLHFHARCGATGSRSHCQRRKWGAVSIHWSVQRWKQLHIWYLAWLEWNLGAAWGYIISLILKGTAKLCKHSCTWFSARSTPDLRIQPVAEYANISKRVDLERPVALCCVYIRVLNSGRNQMTSVCPGHQWFNLQLMHQWV